MSSLATAERLTIAETPARTSLALRNLGLTFTLALLALAIAGLLWGTRGYEMLIVAMGWPHIILGFLFYFGKVLRGEWHARPSFFILALLTLVLWATHYAYTITGFISIYFTYHVFRDEVAIYFQTRARHKLRGAIYVAGFVPFLLLMFIITDPRPQHYRQDLRKVELTDAQLSAGGWTLIPFEPVSYSRGKDFYFYMQATGARQQAEPEQYITLATTEDARSDGEIRISDRRWDQASDLIFKPYYAGDPNVNQEESQTTERTIPIALARDYKVGQTFTAERDNLAGIWIPTRRAAETTAAAAAGQPARFVFHLTPDTSLPLPPLTPTLNAIRIALVLILIAIVLWKALPHLKRNRTFWLYFLFLVAIFAVLQKLIRVGNATGYEFPIMFQLVVVFHYWSWYVFSFDKLNAMSRTAAPAAPPSGSTFYDRMLAQLRSPSRFTMLVIALNLISIAGVFWYSQFGGPATLRYVFDYNYFLYFLVFHVTFSFGPKNAPRSTEAHAPSVSATNAAPV